MITQKAEPWRRRLYFPCYQVKEVARYTHATPQTITRWHKLIAFSKRPIKTEFSYLQLIEVAVVAKFRQAKLKLKDIQEAHDLLKILFKCEYPFATYKFKTDGKDLLIDSDKNNNLLREQTLINLNKKGQLEWGELINPLLKTFDYEGEELAVRWHVAGNNSEILIDPQISFGAPTISGTPTWVLGSRWNSGESVEDIAYDFDLKEDQIKEALLFEGINPNISRPSIWVEN